MKNSCFGVQLLVPEDKNKGHLQTGFNWNKLWFSACSNLVHVFAFVVTKITASCNTGLKGLRQKDFAILGQFCAKIIT